MWLGQCSPDSGEFENGKTKSKKNTDRLDIMISGIESLRATQTPTNEEKKKRAIMHGQEVQHKPEEW